MRTGSNPANINQSMSLEIILLNLFCLFEKDGINDDKVPGKVLMNSGDVRYYIVHQGNYFIFRYLRQ